MINKSFIIQGSLKLKLVVEVKNGIIDTDCG